jgi:DnaJ-domain-containing protein 1
MSITRLPQPKTATGRMVEDAVRKIRPRSAVGKIGVAVGAEIGGALGDGAHRVVLSVVRGAAGSGDGPSGSRGGASGEETRARRWADYVEQARREQREMRRRFEEAFRQAQAGWREDDKAADGGAGRKEHAAPSGQSARGGPRNCRYRGKVVTDYYEVLEVSPRARPVVIEKAYRALMHECHPDLGGDPRKAQLINEAYEVLKDPAERRRFDRENNLP